MKAVEGDPEGVEGASAAQTALPCARRSKGLAAEAPSVRSADTSPAFIGGGDAAGPRIHLRLRSFQPR